MKARKKPVNIVLRIILIILGCVLALVVAFIVMLIVILRGMNSYPNNIKSLKNSNPDGYYFFPDDIPSVATDVNWVKLPSLMQGEGYELLTFYADSAYIDAEIDKYCKGLIPQSYYNMPISPLYDKLDDETKERIIWYEIYNNDYPHKEHCWGIFVDYDTNLIGYLNY